MVKTDEEILDEHAGALSGEEQVSWERGGYYGERPRSMTPQEWSEFKKQKTAKPTSIRLPPELEEAIKRFAMEHGLSYHAAIRMALTDKFLKKSA